MIFYIPRGEIAEQYTGWRTESNGIRIGHIIGSKVDLRHAAPALDELQQQLGQDHPLNRQVAKRSTNKRTQIASFVKLLGLPPGGGLGLPTSTDPLS